MKYYECVSESFTQLILSKILIYTKQNVWLFYEWADSFKEQNKQLFFMSESFNILLSWFIKKLWLIQRKNQVPVL